MSRQRALIYQIVSDSKSHLTADEVFQLARKTMPTIVLATVYNNLNALTDKGAIRRVRVFGEPDRYDRVATAHDHLICDGCGKLVDVQLGDLASEIKQKTGVDVRSYELNIHYLCDECKARQHRES